MEDKKVKMDSDMYIQISRLTGDKIDEKYYEEVIFEKYLNSSLFDDEPNYFSKRYLEETLSLSILNR